MGLLNTTTTEYSLQTTLPVRTTFCPLVFLFCFFCFFFFRSGLITFRTDNTSDKTEDALDRWNFGLKLCPKCEVHVVYSPTGVSVAESYNLHSWDFQVQTFSCSLFKLHALVMDNNPHTRHMIWTCKRFCFVLFCFCFLFLFCFCFFVFVFCFVSFFFSFLFWFLFFVFFLE